MRLGIVPEFGLKPPKDDTKKKDKNCCSRLFGKKNNNDDSDDEKLPKNLAHLKGKKYQIRMI